MLRYVAEDHSVTTVTGSSQFVNLDMAAIAWNAAGSYAYVAGESGYIWAYYEGKMDKVCLRSLTMNPAVTLPILLVKKKHNCVQ